MCIVGGGVGEDAGRRDVCVCLHVCVVGMPLFGLIDFLDAS